MIQLALSTASTFSVTLRLAPSLPWRAAHESVMRVTASTELTLYLGLSHRHLQPSARPEDLRQASTPFIDSNATANFTSHLETALTMEDQHNLLGAIVFWLYIALALIFSFFAIESILKAPSPAPHKHVATFSIMAAISFSTLSFNMLHVLIDSYSTWSQRQVIPLVLSPSSIWQWSITSTLFRNFGEAIVLDDARFLWTQCALMATMSVSFFMGAEGMLSSSHIPYFVRSRWISPPLPARRLCSSYYVREHGCCRRYRESSSKDLIYFEQHWGTCLDYEVRSSSSSGLRNRVSRLWAFFALSQILPISFALNLFYIALLRSPKERRPRVAISRNATLVVLTAYSMCLLIAPYTAEGPYLMPTILAARMLLLVPLFLPSILESREDQLSVLFNQPQAQAAIILFAAMMTTKQVLIVIMNGRSVTSVLVALISHPAVTSLGFDFLITVASFAIWFLVRDTSGHQSISERKKAT